MNDDVLRAGSEKSVTKPKNVFDWEARRKAILKRFCSAVLVKKEKNKASSCLWSAINYD